MAGASLLTLLDDIATILDDVAAMSKVAAKKTAGVLGDDLALNAEQVSGVHSDRELAVVWAVAKGSLLNKVMLVPAALLISVFLPAAISDRGCYSLRDARPARRAVPTAHLARIVPVLGHKGAGGAHPSMCPPGPIRSSPGRERSEDQPASP